MIFVDVDDVLAQWTHGTLSLLGLDVEHVYNTWPPNVWDVCEILPVTKNQIWRFIDAAGENFWANLEPTPWAFDLLNLCRDYAPTTLLTTPSKHPSSCAGKLRWMQTHFGRDFREYLIGPAKWTVSRKGAVLIDDRPRNCTEFVERGGNAIVFPNRGNMHVEHISDPMPFVRAQLDILFYG